MARINYEAALVNSQNADKVSFFSLKHDGEEAIVRFMYEDVSQFEIMTRHQIGEQKSYRTINCLRNPTDPIEACPFCAAEIPVRQSFYVRMIQYSVIDGKVVPSAKIWERSTKFATQLKGYLDNYGPLSNMVCKIIRHGIGLQTTYEIIPNLNPQMFPEMIYIKDTSLFDGYEVLGTALQDRSFQEMNYYVQYGEFPKKENGETVNNSSYNAQSDVPFTYQEPVNNFSNVAPPPYTTPSQIPTQFVPNNQTPVTNPPPWQLNNQTAVTRPVRG